MVSIKAEKRTITGKQVKKLRSGGKIPAVLYGIGKETLLEVHDKDFAKAFRVAGESTLVELEIGGEKRNVLIHDVAFDPIKDIPLHVDFLEVRMDKKLKAMVQLVFEGEAPATKQGGILVKVLHEIEVEALPKDLPHEIKVDVSGLLNVEDRLTVSDLKLPTGVTIASKPDEVLALIEKPREEEEVAVEAEPSLDSIEVVGKKKEKEGEAEEGVEESA